MIVLRSEAKYILKMDYLAYIEYKDKKTMAANQNLMIDALGFDLKKISIKDTYNEQAKKIEVLKEMSWCTARNILRNKALLSRLVI